MCTIAVPLSIARRLGVVHTEWDAYTTMQTGHAGVLLQQTTVHFQSPEATAWYILMLPRKVPVHGQINT